MGLLNKIIISTRTASEQDDLKEYLTEKGAKVLEFPLIEIVQSEIDERITNVLSEISQFDWLIFTSKNGVFRLFKIFDSLNIPQSKLTGVKIATIGSKTSEELEKFGFSSSFESSGRTSSDMIVELKYHVVKQNENVLLVLGELAKSNLEDELNSIANITRVNVYRTIETVNFPVEVIDYIKQDKYDLLVFTSPSGFRHFMKIMKENNCIKDFKIACIGDTTGEEVEKFGFRSLLISSKPDGLSFAKQIEQLFTN